MNCLLCNNEAGYYKAENKTISNCYNNTIINNNYFLDIKNKIWSLCFPSCETCSDYGNITYHNCDSCLNNYLHLYILQHY